MQKVGCLFVELWPQKRLVKYVFYSERSFVAFKVRGPSVVLLNRRCARIRFDVQRFLSVAMLGPVHASVEAKIDLGPGRKQTDDNNNNIIITTICMLLLLLF